MTHAFNTDRNTVIDREYHWMPITEDTPRGAKLQLINRNAGIACYGTIGSNPGFWTHWAPLPTFERNNDVTINHQS